MRAFNLLFGSHDLEEDEERENEFIFFEQGPAERFIKQDLEHVDNVLATIFFTWDGFFNGSFEKVYVELQ